MALATILVGTVGLFDLGVGASIVKSTSELHANDEDAIRFQQTRHLHQDLIRIAYVLQIVPRADESVLGGRKVCVVLAPSTVGGVNVSPCKKCGYTTFWTHHRSQALFCV